MGDSSAIDAGDQTDDRGGNGRQVLDVFEKSDEEGGQESSDGPPQDRKGLADGSGSHLDFQA